MDVFQMRHKSVETVYQIFKLFPKCVPNLQQISHKRLNRRLKSYCDGFPDIITNPFPTIDEFQMCHKSVETFPNYCKLCTKSLTNRQQIGPDIKLHSRLQWHPGLIRTVQNLNLPFWREIEGNHCFSAVTLSGVLRSLSKCQ